MEKQVTLDLEDLVGNLLSTLKKCGFNPTQLSYSLIDEYGRILIHNLNEKNIYCYLRLGRDYTYQFFDDNVDLYEESPDGTAIMIMEELSVNDLARKYQGYLALETLLAMLDDNVTIETLKAYKKDLENSHKRNMTSINAKILELTNKEFNDPGL